MRTHILHVCLSSLLIFTSFFVGIHFEKQRQEVEAKKTQTRTHRIDLTLSGKTLDIQKWDPDIAIYLNGEQVKSNNKQ